MRANTQKNKKWSFIGIEVDKLSWWGLLIAAAAAAFTLAAYFWWFGPPSKFHWSRDQMVWAQFGDYFGGVVGPFIGFASIILLVSTLQLQRTELREQREQLKLSSAMRSATLEFQSLMQTPLEQKK